MPEVLSVQPVVGRAQPILEKCLVGMPRTKKDLERNSKGQGHGLIPSG